MRYIIYKNGLEINTIEAQKKFVENYCSKNGYTYQEDPITPLVIPEPDQKPTDTEVLNALLGVTE